MFPPKSFRHPPDTTPHLGDKKPESRHSLASLRPLSFTRLCLFTRLGPDRRFVFTVPVPSNNNTLADPCRLARVFSKKIAPLFFTFSLGKTPFLQSSPDSLPKKTHHPVTELSPNPHTTTARTPVHSPGHGFLQPLALPCSTADPLPPSAGHPNQRRPIRSDFNRKSDGQHQQPIPSEQPRSLVAEPLQL